MRRAAVVLVAVVMLFAWSAATPADAGASYRRTAGSVAHQIHCRHFRPTSHAGPWTYRDGLCNLRGLRVNVITFKNRHQQRQWNKAARQIFGRRFFWASGAGAVVVARDGNRPAASVGARRLPGALRHG